MLRSISSADGDGAQLGYADSEVVSSPRSMGLAGSRTASLTEEPKWDDIKVKLMCSYGGRILPRPHDNQLRYVGGESRIVVVNRNVRLSELTSKLSKMFGENLVVKYQLPCEDLDALISVTCDEDLENMMEEYDRIHSTGNRASSVRLRLFLFPLKLERSQTSSIIEMMNQTRSSENMFVDILNSMPALPQVRSEASSFLSETQEYLVQGNTDALEEWAAATSYGNSCLPPPQAEQSPDPKQPSAIPGVNLFGSVLQNSGSGEITSAPGSPSPIKLLPLSTGPFSSALPAVTCPPRTQQVVTDVDPSLDDAGGSVPEEENHADGHMVLPSDKGRHTSSLEAAEQSLLPAGPMDDDDLTQKYLAKGSLDEANTKSQRLNSDVGADSSLKHVESRIPELLGQPVFDEEDVPEHVLHIEEVHTSPSGIPSGLAQIFPPSTTPQGHISPVSTTLHHAIQTVVPSAGEDNSMKQGHPVLVDLAVSKSGGEDGYSPSLSHFLSPLASPQDVVGPETFACVPPRPGPSSATIPTVSPTVHQPIIQKVVAAPLPNYLYRQYMQQHSVEPTSSAINSATRAPGNQPSTASQTSSPLINEAVAPSSKAPILSPPAALPHWVPGASRLPSPQTIAPAPSGGVFQPPLPHVKTTIPPISEPPIVTPSVGEAILKKISPTVPRLVHTPTTVISSIGEGVKDIPSVPYQQVELQRQVSEHCVQSMVSPHLSQYAVANLSVRPASGLLPRFQAVGHPIQQVVEGIPVQQSPTVSDKKGAMAKHPSGIPNSQYGYYIVEQSNAQTLLEGMGRYKIPSNIKGAAISSPETVPAVGGNPFVDTVPPLPSYQDPQGVPPMEQQQRSHIWP